MWGVIHDQPDVTGQSVALWAVEKPRLMQLQASYPSHIHTFASAHSHVGSFSFLLLCL